MQNFFVTPSQIEGEEIYIEGSDVRHMKEVLRMRPGERLLVSDGNNCRYLCEVKGYEDSRESGGKSGKEGPLAVLKMIEKVPFDTELPSHIYLFQGLPKQDKMELIIQKCVELGVYEIIPTAAKRCVVKLDAKKAGRKQERWQEIAKSAAKQAGRSVIPQISDMLSFEEALAYAGKLDVLLIPYELSEGIRRTRQVIEGIKPGQSIGIFIGPEGGFEKEEVGLALKAGAKEITLGKRILRTETAGLAIVSVLMFHLEEE